MMEEENEIELAIKNLSDYDKYDLLLVTKIFMDDKSLNSSLFNLGNGTIINNINLCIEQNQRNNHSSDTSFIYDKYNLMDWVKMYKYSGVFWFIVNLMNDICCINDVTWLLSTSTLSNDQMIQIHKISLKIKLVNLIKVTLHHKTVIDIENYDLCNKLCAINYNYSAVLGISEYGMSSEKILPFMNKYKYYHLFGDINEKDYWKYVQVFEDFL